MGRHGRKYSVSMVGLVIVVVMGVIVVIVVVMGVSIISRR